MDTPEASPAARAVFDALLEARTGQRLGQARTWRMETALRPLLRERGMDTLDALVLQLLDGRHPQLGDAIVDALLNQETSFFRDGTVFDTVQEVVGGVADHRPRIWSAGCASGQEPLSLAMVFAERGGAMPEIVATDVSDAAVARARAGRYSHFEIQRGLPVARMLRWFDAAGDDWAAKPELLRLIAFRRHNLLTDPAPAGQFDAVFCRNVLFYLAPPVRRLVLDKLAGALRPGGVLVLGAGETVIGQSDAFGPSARFRGMYEPASRPWPPRAVAAG